MENLKNKYDDEARQNFIDRMHSQSPHKLTKEDKKVIAERWKKIEEYGKKMNKEKEIKNNTILINSDDKIDFNKILKLVFSSNLIL